MKKVNEMMMIAQETFEVELFAEKYTEIVSKPVDAKKIHRTHIW